MKSRVRKNVLQLIMLISIALVLLLVPHAKAQAAVSKPRQVRNLYSVRAYKTVVRVKWKALTDVTGYQVYVKKDRTGSYAFAGSTSKNQIMVRNLRPGSTYYFKVRAYKKVGTRTLYGKFSVVRKMPLKTYLNLVDAMKPYAGQRYTIFTTKNGDSFSMAGNSYSNGFTMVRDGSEVHDLYFNLGGKYSKMSFTWGAVDGEEDADQSTVKIFADGELIATLSRSKNDLPAKYTFSVDDVYQLRFLRSDYIAVGFANVRLFY